MAMYIHGEVMNGQCGVYHDRISHSIKVNFPGLITDLKDYRVNKIACGYDYSYVRTECGGIIYLEILY